MIHPAVENTLLLVADFLWLTNSTIFSWTVVRTFVAIGYTKTYASEVNLHKFPKEIKDSRLQPPTPLILCARAVCVFVFSCHIYSTNSHIFPGNTDKYLSQNDI